MKHKDFVMAMIEKLLEISTTLRYPSTRSAHEKTAEINKQDPIRKRRRVNHKHPHLPPDRVEGPTADHFMTLSLKRSTYKYFSYEMVCFRDNSSTGTPPRAINVYRMFFKSNGNLFVDHFKPYYDRGDNNSIHSSTIDDEIGETDQVLKKN